MGGLSGYTFARLEQQVSGAGVDGLRIASSSDGIFSVPADTKLLVEAGPGPIIPLWRTSLAGPRFPGH
jgi:hypothetical protein